MSREEQGDLHKYIVLLSTFIELGPWARTLLTSEDMQTKHHSFCSQGVYMTIKGNREHTGRTLTQSHRHGWGVIGSEECWQSLCGGAVLGLRVAK